MKFAPEGYPFIVFFVLVTIAAAFLGSVVMVIVLFFLAVFMFYFFRDPDRNVPDGTNLFVSPADGRIIVIRDVLEQRQLNREMKQISIFMSPFNVHVNRAPCGGRVKTVKHAKGRFLAAYKEEATIQNEQIEMVIETRYGNILVRQVAGFVARRAVCRVKEGDILQRGQRYGLIKFSSRVDVYFPKESIVRVGLNDRVKAGETVLAEISPVDQAAL